MPAREARIHRGHHRIHGGFRTAERAPSAPSDRGDPRRVARPHGGCGIWRPKECKGVPPTAITIQQTLLTSNLADLVRFTYEVSPGTTFDPGTVVATTTLTVGSGQTISTVVNSLSKGVYAVHQEPDPASGVAPASDQTVSISPPECVPIVSYTNVLDPA